jgi:hypothetical protein
MFIMIAVWKLAVAVYRYTDNYRFFINTDYWPLLDIEIFDISEYRYFSVLSIFFGIIDITFTFVYLNVISSFFNVRTPRENPYIKVRARCKTCLFIYVGVARCNMSFRLSKSELLERKQRWITNVLEKQKLTSLDIVYMVR